jgi:hypothetical protein
METLMLPEFNTKVKYYDGEVPARETVGGLYIALVRYSEFDYTDTEKYRGPELRVLDADGEHVGGVASVHGPEVRWGGDIEPAEVNWSAIGSVNADITEATAELMLLAAQIAREWTAARMPELLKEKANNELERQEMREEAEAQREVKNAQARKLRAFIGKTVRVQKRGRKSRLNGELAADPDKNWTFYVTNQYVSHDFTLSALEKLEVKNGGRFQEVTL